MGDELIESLLGSEAAMLASVARSMAARGNPHVAVEPLGSARLIALGPGRYVNRAIGLGRDLDRSGIAAIERFYANAGHPAALQLSSLAGPAVLDALDRAGFRATSFRGVHAGSPVPSLEEGGEDDRVGMQIVEAGNVERWLQVLANGNGATTPEARATSDEYGSAAHQVDGSTEILALDGDRAVGCGSMQIIGETAWFGGATTLPDHRNRGIQRQLLRQRLHLAAERRCRVIAATAIPGGSSARNLVRAGLGLVDTQVVLTKPSVGAG